MASIVTYSGGLRRIEFSLTPSGPRKAVRLGRVNAKQAEAFEAKLETIIADRLQHRTHDAETAKWLGELDETLLGRLRAVGLADGVGVTQTTLGAFLERCFAMLTVKPATRTFYGHTRRNLEAHFGAARLIGSITTADADGWRAWLVSAEGLSPATVARRVIAARTLWRRAVRWKVIRENPFADVKGGHQVNEARKQFVSRDIIDALFAAAPDTEWKAIIALARYGGLRTPSETFALKWTDINWERGMIRVTCPKLAHHEHLSHRTIPLFAELREPLLRLFTEAPEGAEYVIARHRLGSANLRTQLVRIIARAGVTAWPRLFQNLRASRESELMREYDLSTVCKWIGNSPAVAAKHYAMSIDLDSDFRRAAGLPAKAQQNAQQTAAGVERQAMTEGKPKSEIPQRSRGFDARGASASNADKAGSWALQDSNL
ncbi:MAG: site-specific integrase [Phycisphaerae bacterium]